MSDNIPNTLSARQAEHDPNFMLSLARGLEVLNAFTPQRQRLTISQLSQKTQISRAAVRRCLYTLAALGMVHSPDGRSYELLPRVLAVGHAYLAGTPLAKVAQTALDNLGKALGESCSAATLDGDNVLYIARAAVNNLLSIDLGRGSRLPAWATSMGRVLLSAAGGTAGSDVVTSYAYSLHSAYPVRFVRFTCRDRPGAHAGLCPRRPADRGRLVLAGGTRAVTSRSGGGRPECRGTCRDGQRRGVKREGSRPATARGDGSVAATIAPTAVSPRWRGCARSRRPAAEAIHPPSPAPGYEPE